MLGALDVKRAPLVAQRQLMALFRRIKHAALVPWLLLLNLVVLNPKPPPAHPVEQHHEWRWNGFTERFTVPTILESIFSEEDSGGATGSATAPGRRYRQAPLQAPRHGRRHATDGRHRQRHERRHGG